MKQAGRKERNSEVRGKLVETGLSVPCWTPLGIMQELDCHILRLARHEFVPYSAAHSFFFSL